MSRQKKLLPTRETAPVSRKRKRKRKTSALPLPGGSVRPPPPDDLPSVHTLAMGSIPPSWHQEDERYRPSEAGLLLSRPPFFDEMLSTAPASSVYPSCGDPGEVPVNRGDSIAPVALAPPPPPIRRKRSTGPTRSMMAMAAAAAFTLGLASAAVTAATHGGDSLRASAAGLSAPELELPTQKTTIAPERIELPTVTIMMGDSSPAVPASPGGSPAALAAPAPAAMNTIKVGVIQKQSPAVVTPSAKPTAQPAADDTPVGEWVPDDV
jgi:hypothetical protein